MTKYCGKESNGFEGFSDDIRYLAPDVGAAKINMGEDWATPGWWDFAELHNQCCWVWTDDYKGSSVAGYIVYKAKNDSDKGKKYISGMQLLAAYSLDDIHIFLPVGGFVRDKENCWIGVYGYYWTSMREESTAKASVVFFNKDDVYGRGDKTADRYIGCSVRAIQVKK